MTNGEKESFCFYCHKSIRPEIRFCPHCGKKQPQPDSSNPNKDPYTILQVSQEAEKEVIDAAYRGLARKYHPDTNKSPDASEKMQDINWAYEVIGNEPSRNKWDQVHNPEKFRNQKAKEEKQREEELRKQKVQSDAEQRKKEQAETNRRRTEEEINQQKVREEAEKQKTPPYSQKTAYSENKNEGKIKDQKPNFGLAIAIFGGICLFLYMLSGTTNKSNNTNNIVYATSSQNEEILSKPQPTEIPTNEPLLKTGDVLIYDDFSKDMQANFSDDKTFYTEIHNGKYYLGININNYPDNFYWTYYFTSWKLNNNPKEVQYDFDITLVDRNLHKVTEENMNKTAIPIEYGFYLGNIQEYKFVVFSLVEWDGKIKYWNISDNNNFYIRKSINQYNKQYETCLSSFSSYYTGDELQVSRGSLVFQNEIKANCGFSLTEKEKLIFEKYYPENIHVTLIRKLRQVEMFINNNLVQTIEIPNEFSIYNSQTDKYDKVKLDLDETNNFGFVLFDYGEGYEVEVDDLIVKIP
jgi:curved DNA-binding protein CbpA